MKTPLSWIKAYVPELEVEAKEFMDAMTLSGSKVERYEKLDADLDNIVVGKILNIEQHPNADKLMVCQVQIGKTEREKVQIVTGASNIKEGDIVPVVLDGGKVAGGHDGKKIPGGIKIKKGKLRGVESFGMMCSIEEFGSTKEMYPDAPDNGIYIFSNHPSYNGIQVGSDAIQALGLRDTIFEYEITSNRVDCFSILGLAREAAATFQQSFQPPVVEVKENNEKISDFISVEVKDSTLCPRYIARVVKNVKIEQSPMWLQRRLAACGIRPINNLVDITNYIMEEYAQPMHAYDLDQVAGKKIVVQCAKDGDTFTTLDGQERVVDSSVLMICDAEKPVGIAGIMGGHNSKVRDDVKTILLEAACFDGANIRISGKKIGLRTDAAGKFEKGLDPNNAMEAMNRACQLIAQLGAGEIVGGVIDVYPNIRKPKEIKFDAKQINHLLGTNISEKTMQFYFEKLGLEYKESPIENKKVIVPTWRQDLDCLADLAEEVARFYGYDNIPTTLPSGETTTGALSFKLRIEAIARTVAEQFGFSEAMNYSFESPKIFDKLLISGEDNLRHTIVISNPLGEDYSIMRTTSLNGMLTSLATNYNRRNKTVRLYELANIYIPKSIPIQELPEERMQLTLGLYGEGDFFYLKGVVEQLLKRVGMNEICIYNPDAGKTFLHPGRQATICYNEVAIGYIGEVHPEVLDRYEIGEKAYIAVLDMPEIIARSTFDIKYKGIAKYPSVTRDISMVMKKDMLVGDIEKIIRKYGGTLLEKYELFDVYEGAQIQEGYKSVAYSITFRRKDRTLEDKDVNEVMEKVLKELNKLGIQLRR